MQPRSSTCKAVCEACRCAAGSKLPRAIAWLAPALCTFCHVPWQAYAGPTKLILVYPKRLKFPGILAASFKISCQVMLHSTALFLRDRRIKMFGEIHNDMAHSRNYLAGWCTYAPVTPIVIL